MLTVSVALFWLVQGLATHSNMTYIRKDGVSPIRGSKQHKARKIYIQNMQTLLNY